MPRTDTIESWRTRREDSPQANPSNWAATPPDWSHDADDPGFMTAAEVVSVLERYVRLSDQYEELEP